MSEFFGHAPQDWERSMMRGMLDGSGSGKAMRDASANPENYTTSRPNMDAEAAFTVGSMRGAGKDGLTRGPSTAYYKIEKPSEPAAVEQQQPVETAAPVETKADLPIELSRRAAGAIESTQNYEDALPQQGTSTIRNIKSPEQQYKNDYQFNLTNDLKANAPGALANTQAQLQEADATKFSLNFAQSGMQPGQAGQRGIEFI